MALTVTVTRGYNFVQGTQVGVDDFNAAALPSVTLTGAVGSSDMANGAVGVDQISDQLVNGLPVITALAAGDKFFVCDLSGAENAGITVAYALNGIFGLAPTATFFGDFDVDTITSHDGTAAQRMTAAYFAESLIGQAPARTTTEDVDEVLIRDDNAPAGSQAARVALANLLPDKGTAGVYSGITSLEVDSKGRVIDVVATGSTTTRYDAPTPVVLPTAAGTLGAIEINTGLGADPAFITCWLRCTDAGGDAGYDQNDEVLLGSVLFDVSGSDFNMPYTVQRDGGTIRIIQPAGTSPKIAHKDTGVDATFTRTSWGVLVNAIL